MQTEKETLEELQEYVTRLQAGSAIIHSLLQEVNTLHEEHENACVDCKQPYPCKTMQILLSTMVEENPAD